MKSSQFNIIYLCPGSWYREFHRKPLVKAISKHPSLNKIYVIEIPADLFHAPIKNPKRILHALKSLFSVSKEDEKIYVYTPLIFLHQLVAYKIPIIRHLNIYLFNKSMQRLCKKEQIENNIVLSVYRPEMVDFINFHDDIMLVYDCYDEYQLTSQDKHIANLDELEKKLMIRSDLIFTTSLKLHRKSLKYNKNSFLIPNAADTELFRKAYLEELPVPDDMRKLKHPIIGYIGAFRDWQDFDLLEYLFENHPQKTFVFIGPCLHSAQSVIKKFEKYQNVYFLGQKKIEELPAYLKYFDVVIIPNKKTIFNESVVPYKLFEYLAAGKKILSTNHSSDLIKFYFDYIEIADDKFEFSEKLNLILSRNDHELQKVFEFGQKQSWQIRVEKMFDLLSDLDK